MVDGGRHRLDPGGDEQHGPWRRAETTALVATSTALRIASLRVKAWWRVRGRRGLLVAGLGVIAGLSGLLNAGGDRGLLHVLTERGIRVDGLVSGVSYFRHGIDSVEVSFSVHGSRVNAGLGIINTVPDTIKNGQRVGVVYDPKDPSQVLLTSQLHDNPIPMDYGVASVGGALTIGGLAWWGVRRRKRE